jgi:pimeloyl-[acyl-carrier protein] methyl ester esterase
MAIAYHGWGFDRECWQPWVERFAQQGQELGVGDRGYFHQPFSPSAARVILAHSYGLYLCPVEYLQQADLLILFSSFLTFYPQQEATRRRLKFMLAQMTSQFAANPLAVWEAFHSKCYYPVPWIASAPTEMNTDLLQHDLKDLDACALDAALLKSIPQVLILHGAQDQIVAPAKGREFWEALPDNSQYGEIAGAGHGLPFSHTALCWDWIEQRLGHGWNAGYK